MKFFTKKSVAQKIILAIVMLLLVNFVITPYTSYAADDWKIGGALAKPIFQFLCWIGDVIMGGLNKFMLGASTGVGGMGSAMLDKNDPNLTSDQSWLNPNNYPNAVKVPEFDATEIDKRAFVSGQQYEIPNMLYSPENIFAGNIAALDVNFIHPNTYESVAAGGETDFANDATEHSKSATERLGHHIADWYKAFRNISIVALLSILIYLGIRILISSTAADKAKHKEAIQNWVIALCLVFFIHFIMSAVLMITDTCTELFKTNIENGYTVQVADGTQFHTNLIGLVRFQAQSKSAITTATYTIMYLALVIYTIIFTFAYLKRFFYMAFFTMIAPLVSLTYPIDKIGDGKSQAFNMWFKEYTMNAIIQPVHLILYSLFVGAAAELAAENPLYALVALAFLVPAEQFIKKMFRMEAQSTSGGIGAFAGGALAMTGLNQLAKLGQGTRKGSGGGKDVNDGNDAKKTRFFGNDMAGKFITLGKEKDKRKSESKWENSNISEGADNLLDNNQSDDNYGEVLGQRNMASVLGNDNESQGPLEKPMMTNDEKEELAQLRDEFDNYDYNYMYEHPYEFEGKQERLNELQNLEYNEKNMEDIPELQGQQSQEQINRAQLSRTNVNAEGKPTKIKGYRKRIAGRAIKGVWKRRKGIARATLGTAARIAGAVTGASIGLAAGITTGDLSKTVSNVAAGAVAGNVIGANTYRGGEGIATGIPRVARAISNTKDNARYAINEETYGAAYAKQQQTKRQNAKARRDFLRDNEEQRQYRELAAKMKYNGSLNSLMNAAADYKEAGITDDKLIHNALKAEYKRGNKTLDGKTHEQFVDVATFAHKNGYGRDYIDDEDKRTSLENTIQYNPTLADNPRAQREAAQTFAEIFDRGDVYKKVGKLGRPIAPGTNNTETNNIRTNNTRTNNIRTNNTRTNNTRTNNTRTNNTRTNNTRTNTPMPSNSGRNTISPNNPSQNNPIQNNPSPNNPS